MSLGAWGAPTDRIPAQRVDELVREVLERSEFHPSISDRLMAAVVRWLEELFGVDGSSASAVIGVLIWSVIGLSLALGLFALVYAFARRRAGARARLHGAGPRAAAAATEREARVAGLLRRAREAEAAGDLALALRLFFFAAVVGLGDTGALEYRDAWTNRELFERGHPSPAVRERLAPLVEELDRRSFGREAVCVDDVRAMQRLGAALLAGGAA